MPIYIYYHITLLNDWKSLLKEQCNRIVFSGLYDRVERIKCYAIDPQDKMKKKCAAFLKRFGEKFVLEKTTKSGNEWFTLQHVKETCQENDRVLYIHTKGITKQKSHTFCAVKIPRLSNNISDWRDLMEYFLIRRSSDCLKILDDGYDTIGVNFTTGTTAPNHTTTVPNHYSGNFWWAHGKHLQKMTYDHTELDVPEKWLHEVPGRFVSLYQSPYVGYGHYFNEFPLCRVIDKTVESSGTFVSNDLQYYSDKKC